MKENFNDLWAPSTRKEKTQIKDKAEVFLKENAIERQHALPPFNDAKRVLADIEDNEERRIELEKLIGKYEIVLAEFDLKQGDFENQHPELFELGKMDEERHRVEQAINQIHTELQYYRTRLQHNDLDFSAFKEATKLKKLRVPFGTKDAALYTGLSVDTINKKPTEYGGIKNGRVYDYYPEKLDEVLRAKHIDSPYWEHPEFIIQPTVHTNDSNKSKPSKIKWNGTAPDLQIRKLIEIWLQHGYIDLGPEELGEYISNRFESSDKDTSPGEYIIWLGGQKELIAYIVNLEDNELINIKSIGKHNYLNLYVSEHFMQMGKNSDIKPFKAENLSPVRALVRKAYNSKGTPLDGFSTRAIEILNEIGEIAVLECN